MPDLTGTSNLVELVGYSRALEMCLTGRAVSAAEARAVGLANLVVGASELDAAVADLIAAITAHPIRASRATAALVRSAVRNDPAGPGRGRAGRPGAAAPGTCRRPLTH